MRKEVKHMQRVDPHGRSVQMLVALFAVSALVTAGFGGSAPGQSKHTVAAFLCPPAC
jgi:hypothetical protein